MFNPLLSFLKGYTTVISGQRFKSQEQLLAWQHKQVQALLAYVLPRSPFYANHFQKTPLEQWQQVPVINKTIMMNNFDTLNTVALPKTQAFKVALKAEQSRNFSPTINGVTVGLSSGTSGQRGLFLSSPTERYLWAGAVVAKMYPTALWQKHRVAFFLRANSNLYTTINSQRIKFVYFDLLDPIAQHIKQLNTVQPTVLVAPPSMLRILATALADTLHIAPQKIISVAEVLDPLDESFISQHFKQTVHQIYQCTEGFLASTCAYGTLHLNEEIVMIEKDILDPTHRKFSPIITDFRRTTQPIIRYRLDDILTERTTPCPCASIFTALESIEGRCDDLFYLKSQHSTQQITIFPDFIRRAIINASPHIQAYIVRQLAANVIEIAIKSNHPLPPLHQAITQSLTQLFNKLECITPTLQFTPLTQEHTGPHKLKRVEQCFFSE